MWDDKKEKSGGTKKGGSGKRRPLRGQAIIQAARAVLDQWSNLSPESHPINISRLAKKLGVTRQAIYDNGLSMEVGEYKAIQKKNGAPQLHAVVRRRTIEERSSFLEKENESLRQIRDGWIERWVAVEYNARMLGIDADKIFAPIPPPHRN
jgi:hypothetical protein